MNAADETHLKATVSKSCSRCRARKVKCSLQLPQCSACTRLSEKCDITDFVTYPYHVVEGLKARVLELELRLASLDGSKSSQAAVRAEPASASGTLRVDASTRDWADDIRKEAEEIGTLAAGGPEHHSDARYIGSAAGSTFARIFFKQLDLVPPPDLQVTPPVEPLMERNASLPPLPVARYLLGNYIARIHVWYPFLSLPALRSTFNVMYDDPRRPSDHEKFLTFTILALSSADCSEGKEYRRMLDVNNATAYFRTGLRFFLDSHQPPRRLDGLQALILLTLWLMNTNTRSGIDDAWQISRYAMSAAIEIGLHRHNTDWGFRAEDLEVRNRTWWTVYCLERQVATITGRVLSVRDHAIYALKPSPSTLDALQASEARAASLFQQSGVSLFNQLIKLRQLSGRILESVYIARGPDGKALDTSFQQVSAQFSAIHHELVQWKHDLDFLGIEGSREYSEIVVECSLLLLLMNRPSPTFMIPSNRMVTICSGAASTAIIQWSKLDSEYGISAVCHNSRQLHSLLVVGLAALYCDWHVTRMGPVVDGVGVREPYRHDNDTAVCLDLVERGATFLRDHSLSKYSNLLQAARAKVYDPRNPQQTSAPSNALDSTGSHLTRPDNFSARENTEEPLLFSEGSGLEIYMNQVSEFFDNGFVMDDDVAAWYGLVMDETQPGPAA
ncbi:fungal-specific transcription factor domain-containing protein [Xylariaceae sp. FL0804]|nr:fungal-specific transcription factor domain-containing protein [Xylariaceae sp. FL0804]